MGEQLADPGDRKRSVASAFYTLFFGLYLFPYILIVLFSGYPVLISNPVFLSLELGVASGQVVDSLCGVNSNDDAI